MPFPLRVRGIKPLAQSLVPTLEPRAHRFDGYAALLGDVARRQVAEVARPERRAIGLGQLGEELQHLTMLGHLDHGLGGRRRDVVAPCGMLSLAPSCPGPTSLARHVAHETEEPGTRGARLPRPLVKRAHHGVLGDVVGLGVVMHELASQPTHAVRVVQQGLDG